MTTQTDLASGVALERTGGSSFKHILLPVDFSASNIAAARYARQLANVGDTRITLLHVTEGATPDPQVADRLNQILGGAGIESVTAHGDPADAITRFAGEHGVDLIVMATRGLGPIRRYILGSVTAKVLQDVDCPVLTFVADDAAAEQPVFRHIACAVDLKDGSHRVMNAAKTIARGTPMTVLHVSPQLEPSIGVVHDREWRNFLASALRAEIDQLARDTGVEAVVNLAGGEPGATVARMASELKVDLLVIGRPQPRALLGRLRAHSYAIVSEAPCPVLSV